MKVGVFTVILGSMKFEQMLEYVTALGVQSIELGTGGYPGTAHCPVDDLLSSSRKAKAFSQLVASHGLQISSLSCHGNPLHPNRSISGPHHQAFQKSMRLAERLGVQVVTTFSGCPGGEPRAKQPNWVTCSWPSEFRDILDYQWNKVVFPYWRKVGKMADHHGIKIALEMHPGFVVYNPETLLRLREEAGSFIGTNFDPSHLFWQGIDPCAAVRALRGAIFHVHAKDTAIHDWNARKHGVLDTKPYSDEVNRAWIFRTVGYGHPRHFWCEFVSSLRMAGYDGTLSIEHEDRLMTPKEGLEKAIRFLHGIILHEPRGK